MYKTVGVAALLVGLLVLTGRNSSAAPAAFTSPVIVAEGKLLNQTTPIPTTTIFTPPQTGLYRLSVYSFVSTADSSSRLGWNYTLNWTDDAGAESSNNILDVNSNAAPPLAWASVGAFGASPGCVATFEAIARVPVTYSFLRNDADNSAISLYWIVERLE